MTTPKRPMDHLPKMAKQHPVQLKNALSLQAANLLQRASLDNLSTKVILVLGLVKPKAGTEPTVARDIRAILQMDRLQTEARRAAPGFSYPDEKIQAVIDKAVDDIAAILLDDVG